MSELQPTTGSGPVPAAANGIFGTKVPFTVTFAIGVLLFFMPFIDIKCNNMTLQTVSGVQLATGFEVKAPGSDNSLVGNFEKMGREYTEIGKNGEKKDPNLFALVALGLGIIAFALALVNGKGGLIGGVVTGILSAAALIGTLIDIKRKIKMDMPEIADKSRSRGTSDFDKLGDSMYVAVDFTAWFYIAVIAFLVGSWFCYKRMQVK